MKMHKRMVGVFCVITLLMTGLIYRIYYIDMSDYITMAAQVQGKYELKVAQTRGMVYDRNLRNLVNDEYKYVASVLPIPQSAAALQAVTEDPEEWEALLERLSDGRPFAMEVSTSNLYSQGIEVFRVPQRYGEIQYAPHLVGYLGDGGTGVSGIEKAYNELLDEAGGSVGVVYQMDATGRVMEGAAVTVNRKNEDAKGGVVLTLDKEIQLLAQTALANGCEEGAAVVLDIYTGDIIAMASVPAFDQNDIAASLERDDAPFINRAVSGYNIGSVFKLIVSAAALESGVTTSFEHDCEGFIDVNGQVFKCNNNAIHGVTDMERALQVSCNTYFIRLAQELDPQVILSVAEHMGIGSSVQLADGIVTQAGNLPGAGELSSPAAYANFSFGQGSSLASPLQMAQAVAALCNSGLAVSPRLVAGVTEDGDGISQHTPVYSNNRILSEQTAKTMQRLMVSVIEDGSGRTAKPVNGGAGGKTSSAQTGQFYENEEREIVHAWFAGFYPADSPKYSIVVFVEGGESGEQVAAPIFKQIADGIDSVSRSR